MITETEELRCVISDLMDQVRDAVAKLDALQARIDASPIVKRRHLECGIIPGDYDMPLDWNKS